MKAVVVGAGGSDEEAVKAAAGDGCELRGFVDRDELLDLYDDVSADDPRSVALLDAFLDREHEGWRDEYAERAPSGAGSSRRGWGRPEAEPMSRQDALKILGLGDAPSEDEIKDAHRKLMMKHHPDVGGSDYFAAKINQAKDVLLNGR